MIKLHSFQETTIAGVRDALRRGVRRVLAQSPTGSGKTIMATDMVSKIAASGKRVYFNVHRQELIHQTAGTFDKNHLDYSYLASGHSVNLMSPIQICSIDTIKRRVESVPVPDYAFIDECHHATAAGWAAVLGYWYERGCKIIGLSATPCRLDGRGLNEHFDELVEGVPVSWLIENEFLSDYRLFAPSTPDTSSLHTLAGDFRKDESANMMDKPSITGDIVDHWLKYGERKKTVAFAVNIRHSEHLAESFRQKGVKAQHIDGKTPKKLRAEMCRDFADGKIEVLLNVDLFGEGYDLAAQAGKDVTIDCVIQARPTQSLSLHLQQVGRGLRKKSDGSKALLLDHAGNWMRHGLPDDERVWSLEGEKRTRKKRQSAEEAGSVRQCPTCYGVHEPAPKCPYCGHVYESAGRKIEEREGELQEINTSAVRRSHLASQGRARTPEQMRALGYSAARTAHIMAARAEKTALQNTLRGLLKEANETITEHEMKKMKPKALKSMIVEMKTKLNKNGHQLFLES